MAQKYIAEPLGLIDPGQLKKDEKFLFFVNYEMFPDKTTSIFLKNEYLVVHSTSWNPLKKIWSSDQDEFPIKALAWIVDRFENDFFKPQEQGGVSDFERSLRQEFNGELIGINAMVNCCAENMPGFNIWNGNRKSYIARSAAQQWDIPRHMLLEQGLLSQLKSLADDFEHGRL